MKLNDKKSIKLSIVLMLILFILTGCQKEQENSAIFEEVVIDEEGQEEDTKKTPSQTIDKDGNIVDAIDNSYKSDTITQERVDSIYKQQLSKRSIKAFDEIEKAIKEEKDSVALKTVIPEKDLHRIMNIIMLDKPEYFYLSNRYSYEVDKNNNAIVIYFKYVYHKDFIGLDKKARELKLESLRKDYDFNTPKKDAVSRLYSSKASSLNFPKRSMEDDSLGTYARYLFETTPASSKLRRIEEDKEKYPYPDEEDYYAIINKLYVGSEPQERFAVLSSLSDELRELGIESSLVLGEIVSYDLIGENFNEMVKLNNEESDNISYYIPKFIHHDKLNKIERNGNKVDVSTNYYNAHPWLVVKINNKWYNIDPVLDITMKSYIKEKLSPSIEISEPLFLLVPDIMISGTRIINYTEEVLGISPACQSSEESDRITSDKTITKSGIGHFNSDAKDRLVSLRGDSSPGYLLLSFTNPLDIESYDNVLKNVASEEDVLEIQGLNRFKTAIFRDLNLYVIYDYER